MWDWLPHDLSTAFSIFKGEPAFRDAWAIGEPLTHTAVTQYTCDSVPVISLMSWHSPLKRKSVIITGERGSLVFDDNAEKKVIVDIAGEITYPDYDTTLPLTNELRAFIDAVTSKSQDRTSLDLGVSIVSLIAQAEAACVQ